MAKFSAWQSLHSRNHARCGVGYRCTLECRPQKQRRWHPSASNHDDSNWRHTDRNRELLGSSLHRKIQAFASLSIVLLSDCPGGSAMIGFHGATLRECPICSDIG